MSVSESLTWVWPPHDWVVEPVVSVSEREMRQIKDGRQRFVFRKLDLADQDRVRDVAIKCARCGIPVAAMSVQEERACRA